MLDTENFEEVQPFAASGLWKAVLASQYHQSQSHSSFRPVQILLPHKAFPDHSAECDPKLSDASKFYL